MPGAACGQLQGRRLGAPERLEIRNLWCSQRFNIQERPGGKTCPHLGLAMVHLVETCLRHQSSSQTWSRNGNSSRVHQEPRRRIQNGLLLPSIVRAASAFSNRHPGWTCQLCPGVKICRPLYRVDLPTMPRGQRLQPPPHGEPVRLHHTLTMEDIRPGNTHMSIGEQQPGRGFTCQRYDHCWRLPLLPAWNPLDG
jgi:hypothetical protein